MSAGIEAISFYTPHFYLDMRSLAQARGLEVDRFYHGIGQEKMAVPPPGEDVVTMAANAAARVLERVEKEDVEMLIFATESGIDQAKAGGIYVHSLLGLSSRCRVFEVKQACYAATAGLQLSLPMIEHRSGKRVLIVAADVARYGLGSQGEPTQGAGAVAMLVSAQPRLVEFDGLCGLHTEDVMDFWRPNDRDEALVDGPYSVRVYLRALASAWQHYAEESGRSFADFDRFCYHLPFTRMAEKAHKHLARIAGNDSLGQEVLDQHIGASLNYNRVVGNTYAASLYVGLASLLETSSEDLSGARVAFFSYGSGCMGEFFSGRVRPGYRERLFTSAHRDMLDSRTEISYSEYEDLYTRYLPEDPRNWRFPEFPTGRFRLAGIADYKRIYEKVA